MATDVGSLRAVQFKVLKSGDVALGKEVRLQVALLTQKSAAIKQLVNEAPAVTVNIKTYGGSGAVTIYRSKSITVSKDLGGGVREIAESIVFELCNWNQGDFSSREHEKVKNGEITPQQAGRNIAKCESKTIHQHGELMQSLKNNGCELSAFGERNRSAVTGKSLAQVEQQTMISSHDSDAAATEATSLDTPLMYWYQMIDGRYFPSEFHVPVMKQGINGVRPEWLDECIEKVWANQNDAPKAQYFVKLCNLAKEYGLTLKGGYEFTPAMRTVAGEPSEVPATDKRLISDNVIGKIKDEPEDLIAKLKVVGFQ